jgi:hypothetical protein
LFDAMNTRRRAGRYDAGVFTPRIDRPLVFLDVDGPLIPFRGRPIPAEFAEGSPADDGGNPLLDRLDPQDGRLLLALGCPLIWATTWGAEANEVISPRLGLPTLPVVEWPDDDSDPRHGLHWKTTCLSGWAAGQPFVWLDDEISDTDRQWMGSHHPARTLLHRVDPFTGLTPADFAVVHDWLSHG